MKKKSHMAIPAVAMAAALVLGVSIPANAATNDIGSTFCSGFSPVPWLRAQGGPAVGGALVTPPRRGYSTLIGLSVTPWYGQGVAPGGGWSVWTANAGGYYADINMDGTYGYCTPN